MEMQAVTAKMLKLVGSSNGSIEPLLRTHLGSGAFAIEFHGQSEAKVRPLVKLFEEEGVPHEAHGGSVLVRTPPGFPKGYKPREVTNFLRVLPLIHEFQQVLRTVHRAPEDLVKAGTPLELISDRMRQARGR